MRNLLALTVLIALAGSSGAAAYADPATGPKAHKFGPHTLYGRIASVSGNSLVLQRLNGKQIVVDITDAKLFDQLGVTYVGRPVALHGDYVKVATGTLVYHVNSVTSANGISFGSKPPDN